MENADIPGGLGCTQVTAYPINGLPKIGGIEVYTNSACPNGVKIIPNAIGAETSILFVGGAALDKFWVVGQNPFGVLPGNFAICSNYITGNPSGIVQANVGLQINQDGAVYIPNTLNTWVVNVNQNAYIHVLQVNQNTFLNGGVFLNSMNINDIYQKRPWVSIRVDYSTFTQRIITITQRGQKSATVDIQNNGF